MKLTVKSSLALAGIMALVLAGCSAETDSSSTSDTTSTPDAADSAEVEEVEEKASDAAWTMLEYFEVEPDAKTKLDNLRAIASADAVPVSVEVAEPIKIGFVFPSFNLSEGFARGAIALEERLKELEIPYQIDEYGSTDQDHQRQSSHVDAILAADYDFVIFGPTEMGIQKANIERMMEADIPLFIWNYVTPFKDFGDNQPLSYIGFDHAEGAKMLCEWALDRTGGSGDFADMRFIPGFIDDERNGVFSDCVEEGGMTKVYDHFSDGDSEKAYQGMLSTLSAYPDVVMVHNGNTASALGAARAATERGVEGDILMNGWGGGQSELDSILDGALNVTPLRLQDDFGVFPAEMIKMHLEGNADDIPLIGAGELRLIDDTFSAADMAEATEYAYRYSKVLER